MLREVWLPFEFFWNIQNQSAAVNVIQQNENVSLISTVSVIRLNKNISFIAKNIYYTTLFAPSHNWWQSKE